MKEPMHFEDVPFRYIVGIDLGTTNSAVAYVESPYNNDNATAKRSIRILAIPQLVAPGQTAKRPILPSFLYLPGHYDLAEGSAALPWDPKRDYVVGEFAREQGALVPGRLVSSAKSWLCHAGVDRMAPILPWGAKEDVAKVSPVQASSRYLQHIREAWNETIARGRDGYLLEEQLIVLTVPASFDEVARELTVLAAQEARLGRVILLEEPLAAFYAWLSHHEQNWQSEMKPDQLVLVCDVGGGTTDFTIVATRKGESGIRFDRLAVGDHLMLGGDNMDLTLARRLEIKLLGKSGELDSKRWHQLCHQCRKAKEKLLSTENEREDASIDITVMGSGGRLIADTLKGTLTKRQVYEWILEGFFPAVALDSEPADVRRTGISEWGLPYVQDPAMTRHLAAFWRRHQDLIIDELPHRRSSGLHPDYILFNGGALTPAPVRQRIQEVVGSWFGESRKGKWAPRELVNIQPELAVAVGAAYYGLVRLGEGVRVGAGSPRTYYVGVESNRRKERKDKKLQAVCLVPRGTEEGYQAMLAEPAFEVLTNKPVAFQLLASSTRLGDRLGDVVNLEKDEVVQLPPIRTALRYGKKGSVQKLPVQLAIRLNEIGTLELWCQSLQSPHTWQLQFDVRQNSDRTNTTSPMETLDQDSIDAAKQEIRNVFRKHKDGFHDRNTVLRLPKIIAATLELPKEKWSTSLIRQFADLLIECKQGRTLTPDHEARWLNLLGYCMRPGFGDPVDEWRIREIWKLYPQGIHFHRQAQCRSEWWVFWRRVAGGLKSGQQLHIYQQVAPALLDFPKRKKKKSAQKGTKRFTSQEELEVMMALANFERLSIDSKIELGKTLLQRICRKKVLPQELWALSRLGARIPFYGPLDRVVPKEIVGQWLEALVQYHPKPTQQIARAVVQMARLTGDRERDLPQQQRDHICDWLESLEQAEQYLAAFHQPETSLRNADRDWVFGESLPAGLILSEEK